MPPRCSSASPPPAWHRRSATASMPSSCSGHSSRLSASTSGSSRSWPTGPPGPEVSGGQLVPEEGPVAPPGPEAAPVAQEDRRQAVPARPEAVLPPTGTHPLHHRHSRRLPGMLRCPRRRATARRARRPHHRRAPACRARRPHRRPGMCPRGSPPATRRGTAAALPLRTTRRRPPELVRLLRPPLLTRSWSPPRDRRTPCRPRALLRPRPPRAPPRRHSARRPRPHPQSHPGKSRNHRSRAHLHQLAPVPPPMTLDQTRLPSSPNRPNLSERHHRRRPSGPKNLSVRLRRIRPATLRRQALPLAPPRPENRRSPRPAKPAAPPCPGPLRWPAPPRPRTPARITTRTPTTPTSSLPGSPERHWSPGCSAAP